MGADFALIEATVALLSTHGLLGAVIILFGVLLWLLRQHGQERKLWMEKYDEVQTRALDTIDKNTEALGELKTIVSLVVMKHGG
jgi:hypothetical protein